MARGFLEGRFEAGCKFNFTLRGDDGCHLAGGDGSLFILEDGGGGEGEGECEGDLFSRMKAGDFAETSDDRRAEAGGNGGAPRGLNGGPGDRESGGGGTVIGLSPGGGGSGRGATVEAVFAVVLLSPLRPLSSSHLRRLVPEDISSAAASTETGRVSRVATFHQFSVAVAAVAATDVAAASRVRVRPGPLFLLF